MNSAAGQGIVYVPISWCVVEGSPAATDPNIPNSSGGVDTTTDDVLLRRVERINDNIYLDPAGIAFQSAIDAEVHTSPYFPIISDPDPELGTMGNITKEDFYRREFNQVINQCKMEWENKSLTQEIYGIPTINIRRFVDNFGMEKEDLIGTAFCIKDQSTGYCDDPYDGYVFVIDNFYTAYGASGGWNNDPLDVNLGHELGHALGLSHRNEAGALMHKDQQEGGDEQTVNNVALTNEEISILRNSAALVPGSIVEFSNISYPINNAPTINVDTVEEGQGLLPHQDLSSVQVNVDKEREIVTIDHQLFGLFPDDARFTNNNSLQYWTLVNIDNSSRTGAHERELEEIGVPLSDTTGVDLVFLGEVVGNSNSSGNNIQGRVWKLSQDNQTMSPIPNNMTKLAIQTAQVELHYRNDTLLSTKPDNIPLYNTISTELDNSKNTWSLNTPFSIQAFVSYNGTTFDRLDE